MARLITILGYVCAFAAVSAHAATFTVTTTADSGAGSLRQAILDANANGNAVTDTIAFNIPAAGVQTIAPVTALPNITTPVLIDGYTQPGSSPNTLPFASGTNAVILIALDGVDLSFEGLLLEAGGTVRGLSIQRFSSGILAYSNTIITGNFIGTDATGMLARGNQYGIYVENGTGNQIGTVGLATRNVISSNTQAGVSIGDGSGHSVAGNYIGIAADGTTALGNGVGIALGNAFSNVQSSTINNNVISGHTTFAWSSAIEFNGNAHDNVIAGNRIGTFATGVGSIPNRYGIFTRSGSPYDNIIGTSGAPNIINNSLLDGIELQNPGLGIVSGFAIQYNAFLNNGDLAIDLNGDGVTANDPLDTDGGPNTLQNFPVITSATRSTGGAAIVNGTLHSAPSTQFNVQLYYNVACDASGNGEGSFVAETPVTTNAGGNAAFTFTEPFLPSGGNLTAIATDPNGNTSELGECTALVSEDPQLTVNSLTIVEGDAGTSIANFTVTLSPASQFPVTVNVAAVAGSATSPSDFTAAPQLLTFAPGETTKMFAVTIHGDTTPEGDETFTVALSDATNASIASNGTGTIEDDDAAVAPADVPTLSEAGILAIVLLLAGIALTKV